MMIHKIEPHKYYPEFRSQDPKPSDYLLLFDGEKVYLPSHTENSDVTDTSAGAGISEHPQAYLPTFLSFDGRISSCTTFPDISGIPSSSCTFSPSSVQNFPLILHFSRSPRSIWSEKIYAPSSVTGSPSRVSGSSTSR